MRKGEVEGVKPERKELELRDASVAPNSHCLSIFRFSSSLKMPFGLVEPYSKRDKEHRPEKK